MKATARRATPSSRIKPSRSTGSFRIIAARRISARMVSSAAFLIASAAC
jgi:hypothetical protein